MDAIEHYDAVDVFIGVDVGKGEHHAVALNRAGKRLFDKALPNDETRLRTLISGLKEHGKLLLVVDQPTTIGALPVTVARAEGILVAYLPGLAMRRIADLHAGEAKTDARDAASWTRYASHLPSTICAIQKCRALRSLCCWALKTPTRLPGRSKRGQAALRKLCVVARMSALKRTLRLLAQVRGTSLNVKVYADWISMLSRSRL